EVRRPHCIASGDGNECKPFELIGDSAEIPHVLPVVDRLAIQRLRFIEGTTLPKGMAEIAAGSQHKPAVSHLIVGLDRLGKPVPSLVHAALVPTQSTSAQCRKCDCKW